MASGRVASHASCSKADPGEAGWVSLLPCRIDISDSGARGGTKASGIGSVGSPARAAYPSNQPEHSLRKITAKLKLRAMDRRFDPLIHSILNHSRYIEPTAQEMDKFVPA